MPDRLSEIDIAPFIDHSLLNPCAPPEYLRRWCDEAERFGFATVCVFPNAVRQAAEYLHNKAPNVCTVIGFPTGATTPATKLYEAAEAVENGATELDVVLNLGQLKAGDTNAVHGELAEICEETGVTVKAILETNLLVPEEKEVAVRLCLDAGVQYLKTCTGWNGGVKLEDVVFLKEAARGQIGIKASGGIRDYETAASLILAGASRLGTSYSVNLLRDRERLATAEANPSDQGESSA